MRDIRFRAWDGEKIIQDFDIYSQDGRIRVPISNGALFPDPEKTSIMQYTGLKDKNGVEIYEGDIIAHGEYIIKPGAVVQWDNLSAAWSVGPDWPFNEFYECGVSDCEVIGNIHENPKLLK